jgi:hypothetical protein|tara:strand:+ start:1452 stop:1706 length:255 start_codon:yes stop_codon:yes gene_type:complete
MIRIAQRLEFYDISPEEGEKEILKFLTKAEARQTFHSYPLHVDTLCQSTRQSSPFHFCPTSSAAEKYKRQKKPLAFPLPNHIYF